MYELTRALRRVCEVVVDELTELHDERRDWQQWLYPPATALRHHRAHL